MGQIKNYLQDWLDNFGWELGYDMSNVPELPDLHWVAEDGVDAETYWTEWKHTKNPKESK